jgi:hypothetical protein
MIVEIIVYVALSILTCKENNKSFIVPVVEMFVSVCRDPMFEPS